jgi:hypothetical protein
MPIGVFWRPEISLLEYTISGDLSLIEYQRCLHDEQLLLEAKRVSSFCMLLDIHDLRTLPPYVIQLSRHSILKNLHSQIRFIGVVGANSFFRAFISITARAFGSSENNIGFFATREEALRMIDQVMAQTA